MPAFGARWEFRLIGGSVLAIAMLFVATALGQDTPSKESRWGQKSIQRLLTPEPERVFRLESEATLRDRMDREGKEGINPLTLKYDIIFPDYPPIPSEQHLARHWNPLVETMEAPYVCYNRLYFEQINKERYGWELSLFQPLVSAGVFFFDVLVLPYKIGTQPLRLYECNSGYYLPGDPAPFLIYPPILTLTGGLSEASAIGLGFLMFP